MQLISFVIKKGQLFYNKIKTTKLINLVINIIIKQINIIHLNFFLYK